MNILINEKKYWMIFRNEFLKVLEYKEAFMLRLIADLITTGVFVMVWINLYDNGFQFGYSKNEMIAYYIIAGLLDKFAQTRVVSIFSRKINRGDLSQLLLKPINIIKELFVESVGIAISRNMFSLLVYVLIIITFILTKLFAFEWVNILLFLLYLPLALILNYTFYLMFALLSFWFVQADGLALVIRNLSRIIGGAWLPLYLLPAYVQNLIKFLPFQYIVYFPITIILGKNSLHENMTGFTIVITEIVLFYIISKILLHKGLYRYDAVGS